MRSSQHTLHFVAAWVAFSLLLLASLSRSAHAQENQPDNSPTSMVVIVKESDGGQPISQAHITLEFFEARSLRKPKKISYNGKTDQAGRCKFTEINKGAIVLTVTSPGHQSYGKELQLANENQVFEVSLKKPQPLI